jgi:hypothetical protein
MSKPGLGKGLGSLMNGDRVAGGDSKNQAIAKSDLGRGLGTLVAPPSAPEDCPTTAEKKHLLPAWFFYAADLLLLSFTVGICIDAPRPMDIGSLVLCAVAVALGACLSTFAVLRE